MTQVDISAKTLERLQQLANRTGQSVDDVLQRLLDESSQPRPPEILQQLFLEHTSDIISLFDPDLRYVYVNSIVGQLTGNDPTKMIGKTDQELGMPTYNIAGWRAAWDVVIETHEEQIITFDYETPNGIRVFESRLTPIYDDEGMLIYLLAITRDVTERNQTKKMLKDFTRRLPGMVLSYRLYPDGSDEVTFVSDGIEAIYEVTPEEAYADLTLVWAKIHADDLPQFAKSVDESATSLTLWDCEWRIRMDDGSIKWLHGLGTPYRLPDGSTTWNTLLLDITDRKQAEARYLEIERARIETQEQRKVINLKERFIATASHDFRIPLTVIKSTTSMLQDFDSHYTHEQRREKLQILQDQVVYMTRLLDEVLTVSQSQAHKLDVMMTDINLPAFVHAIWESVVIIDGGAHLKSLNVNTPLKQFVGDPHLLRQVFENLLGNALKYTPNGKRVTFEVTHTAQWLIFKVVDEGYGIPAEDQPHVFDAFHRARNVTKMDGTGLGLTIVRDFVVVHEGNISLESKEGEGTTFTVMLPLAIA